MTNATHESPAAGVLLRQHSEQAIVSVLDMLYGAAVHLCRNSSDGEDRVAETGLDALPTTAMDTPIPMGTKVCHG